MSGSAERAISFIKSVDGEWVAKIYGVRGKRRRLAITATGSLDYTRRVSALYGAPTLEVDSRPPRSRSRSTLKFTTAHAVAMSRAANDCEAANG